MAKKELRGVYSVMTTPFTADGSKVDDAAFKACIDFQIEQGVAGLCLLGSTGEFVSMTEKERKDTAEMCMKHVNGRVPVVFGTAAATTKEVVDYTKHVESIGADGAMVLTPYYYGPQANEILEFYKDVSEAVKEMPIMVYNNPFTSGVDMKPELLAEIAKLPHMEYVKDASNEIRRVREIQALSPLKVFNGGDDIAFEAFVLGAIGWISVAANVIPKQCQEIFDLVWADKIREAEKLYFEVLPIISHIEECGKPAQTVKAALNKMGLPGGYCRKPRIALLPEEDAALEAVMKKVGLIK